MSVKIDENNQIDIIDNLNDQIKPFEIDTLVGLAVTQTEDRHKKIIWSTLHEKPFTLDKDFNLLFSNFGDCYEFKNPNFSGSWEDLKEEIQSCAILTHNEHRNNRDKYRKNYTVTYLGQCSTQP